MERRVFDSYKANERGVPFSSMIEMYDRYPVVYMTHEQLQTAYLKYREGRDRVLKLIGGQQCSYQHYGEFEHLAQYEYRDFPVIAYMKIRGIKIIEAPE